MLTIYKKYKGLFSNRNIKIPLFGFQFEELFDLLEESKVISRISVYAFLVNDKEAFYSLIGEKRKSQEEFSQYLKDFFNKKRSRDY